MSVQRSIPENVQEYKGSLSFVSNRSLALISRKYAI